MTTAFRAAVMLGVLVGLPAAWIYYGPLPAGAQRVVDQVVGVAKESLGWGHAEQKPAKPSWTAVTPAPAWTGAPTPVASASPVAVGPTAIAEPKKISPSTAASPAAPPPSLSQRIEPLLARLRQLGASEYAMEKWGAQGRLYRFRCEMTLPDSPLLTQEFEAVAADPQASVEQVVKEVAHWASRGEHTALQ